MAAMYTPVPLTEDEKYERIEDFTGNVESQTHVHGPACDRCLTAEKKTRRSIVSSITPLKILLALALCPIIYGIFNPSRSFGSLLGGEHDFSTLNALETEEDLRRAPMCETLTAREIDAPKENVFRNLDVDEAVALRKWLHAEERGLNLSLNAEATSYDNSIFVVEIVQPNKKATLKYLDHDGDKPLRYAHATINHGAAPVPHIRDYLVGPLPVSGLTKIRPFDENYHNPIIPHNGRLYSGGDWRGMQEMLKKIMEPLGEVTMDLFGGVIRGNANDTLMLGGQAPASFDGTWRRSWMPLKLKVPGSYLHVLDLQLYTDMSARDSKDWSVLKVWYNSQIFVAGEKGDAIQTFISAWQDGSLVKSQKHPSNDTDWATRARTGTPRDLDEKAGPRQISFDGPRFRVSEKDRYVSYMGWTFYLGFGRDLGIAFHDIKFRGERIIYELAPQEAMAQYSGLDPSQSTTVWLDGAFGMGQLSRALIPGYDCPVDAHYMSATVHPGMGSITQEAAICIFEQDTTMPLSRHYAFDKDEMGATKGHQLVVRQIATVGNYDYAFSYAFQLDGTIETRFSASGYMQGGFYDGNPERADYGQRIRETSMGALHDHVINYKIDFDVGGTKNTVTKVTLENEPLERAWFDEDWGYTDVGGKIVHTKITNEDHSRLDYGLNSGGMYVVQNEESFNKWGVPRGYAIHPGVSNIHLTNIGGKRTLHNCDWAKNSLSVVKRKENEPASSNPFNINLPGKPPVDFANFFDGDNLEQEDLVVYLNLGTHHIPRAEDVPHTLTNIATSYVMLTPYNFHDSDVSMEAMNSVIINTPAPAKRGPTEPVEDNDMSWTVTGHVEESYCIPPKIAGLAYGWRTKLVAEGAAEEDVVVGELRMQAEMIHSFQPELAEL